MPTYTFNCCDEVFDKTLSFKEYDKSRVDGKDQLIVKCSKCLQYHAVVRTYEGSAPGVHFGLGFFKDGYESAKNVTRKEE